MSGYGVPVIFGAAVPNPLGPRVPALASAGGSLYRGTATSAPAFVPGPSFVFA